MAKRYVKEEFETKADKARAEREARIEALKAKDGSFKPVAGKKSKAKKSLLTILGSVLAVLVIGIFIAWQTGFVHRRLPAISVGNNKVSINEYNHAYFSVYNIYNRYFGQGGLLDLKANSSNYTQENKTWGEFFTDTAMANIKKNALVYGKAVEAGYTANDEDRAAVKQNMTQLQQSVGTPVDFEIYLRNLYGNGMTVEAYEEILLKEAVAKRYAADRPASYDVSQKELDDYYATKKTELDTVTYHSFILKTLKEESEKKDENSEKSEKSEVSDKSEDSDDEKDEKDENDSEKNATALLAEDILKELTAADKVEKIAEKYAVTDEEKKVYQTDEDVTLHENNGLSAIANKELSAWLFDDARKAGDSTYVKVDSGYEIAYFVSREKDTRNIADIRIMSFNLYNQSGDKKDEETIKLIKDEASRLEKNIKSEEDLLIEDKKLKEQASTKLANESVKIEKINGFNESGLNSKVLNYALSKDAKKGDTKVIETSGVIYLVHIVEKHDTQSWEYIAKDTLQKTKYNEDFEAMLEAEENQVEKMYPGFWFIKRS